MSDVAQRLTNTTLPRQVEKMVLSLILALLWFCETIKSSPIQTKLPKLYTILIPDSSNNNSVLRHSAQLVNGHSIHELFHRHFCSLISHDECFRYMDQASEDYYGVHYTPSRLSSTIEDYYSDRTDLLKYLVQRFQSKKYLEIGCQGDLNFNQMREIVESAIGVDPISGGTHRLTSDEFFQQNSEQFDLIFVDGDHTALQVWRDIKNSLLALADNGVVVIHDLNPRLKDRSEKMDTTVWLNSDGWKAAVAMRLTRDYEMVIVDIDHGCGVIRKRRNRHGLPKDLAEAVLRAGDGGGLSSSELVTEGLVYEDLERYREDFLRLMSLVQMREWLEEKESE
jgi:hypothetical protein